MSAVACVLRRMSWLALPYKRRVPVPRVKVLAVRSRFARTLRVVALSWVTPEAVVVALPVVVATPPRLSVPLLKRVLLKSIVPEFVPIAPVEDTAPTKLRAAEVEVTVLSAEMFVAPRTLKAVIAAKLYVEADVLVTFMAPRTVLVVAPAKVAVPPLFTVSKLLR